MKKKICKPLYSFRKYFFGTFVSNANVFQLIDPFLFDLVSRVFHKYTYGSCIFYYCRGRVGQLSVRSDKHL